MSPTSKVVSMTPKKPGKRPPFTVDPDEVAKLKEKVGPTAADQLDGMDAEELNQEILRLVDIEEELEQRLEGEKKAAAATRGAIKGWKIRRRLATLLKASM